ncbi:MAG: TetR/AcrR family transcriptional regulator [Actinomycetota bacterium]|nr:TetR/AcrR family transcriptional regulator [Actinomycetota bacterium]
MTQTEPRWRRLEPDQRKQQILSAAVRRFGSSRYSDVSVADIAKDAGVARGLVNHYYGNKRELYLTVVRTMMFVPPLEAAEVPTGSRRERIDAVVGWLMDIVEAHGRGWIAIASSGTVGTDPEVQDLLDKADDLAAERVLDVVDFAGTPEERAVALASVRAFGGMAKAISRELIERRSMTSEQARRHLAVALEAILGEFAPSEPGP